MKLISRDDVFELRRDRSLLRGISGDPTVKKVMALFLRRRGHTYEDIADRVGYPNRVAASKAVRSALAREEVMALRLRAKVEAELAEKLAVREEAG